MSNIDNVIDLFLYCRPLSYPDTDVILICFSIANRDSLQNVVDKWMPEIRHFCPKVPVILVGTKTDLRNDPEIRQELSKTKTELVSSIEGASVARTIKAADYVECSAKTRDGVQKIFEIAAVTALQKRSRIGKLCKIL